MTEPKKKIKVVHIITRLILGGAQEVVVMILEHLKNHPEFEITLIAGPALGPEGEMIERVQKSGINLIIVPQMRRNINPLYDFIALWKLFFILLKLKPDIVHTHSAKAGFLGRFAAWLVGTKTIIHTLHGVAFHPYQNKIVNYVYIVAERMAGWVTTKFISVADAMTEEYLKVKVGKPEKYITIYNALESDYTEMQISVGDAKKKLGLENYKVATTIARLFPLKGHEYILEIAPQVIREVPDVRFLFVGDGILSDSIKREIQGRGIEKWFVFTGLVQPKQIPAILQATDVLVHPSLREGLPRTIQQAYALGKPVISFDIGGARELVKNQETGFLIPPPALPIKKTGFDAKDKEKTKQAIEDLTRAIITLLKDDQLAQQMGTKGRQLIYPNCDANYMVNKIIEVYNSEHSR